MAENSHGQMTDTVRVIREIYESYESLHSINPKQNPGFVIQHLEKIFDKEQDSTLTNAESIISGDKMDILGSIRTVYNVYKTLCKYDLDGAPGILIQNLKEILSKEEEPKVLDVNMDFVPMEEESDLNIKIVKTQSLPFGIEDDPQWGEANQDPVPILNSTMHLKKEEEEMEQVEQKCTKVIEVKSTKYYYKCSTCSEFFQDRKVWKKHQRLHNQETKDSFLCKYCKTSFPQINLLRIHQAFCSKSPRLNKNFKSSSFQLAKQYRHLPSTASSTSQMSKVTKNELSTSNSRPNSNTKPVNDGSDAMATKIRQIISEASRKTLTSVGLNPSSFPTRDKTYSCHICPEKDWGSLERLANHMRTHLKEPEYPFHCFHPMCEKKFNTSSNFRAHLKYPHTKNGSFIGRSGNFINGTISSSKSQIPINRIRINNTSRMRRNPLKSRRRNRNNKKFICFYCDLQLSSKPALSRHIRIHTGECPFSCLKCPSKFNRTEKLRQHEAIYHRTEKSVLNSFDKNSKSKSLAGQNESTLSKFPLDSPNRKYNEELKEQASVPLLPVLAWPWAKEEEENHNDDKTEDQELEDEEHFETETNKSDPDYRPRNFYSSSSFSSRGKSSGNTINTYSCTQCNRKFMNRGHFISHFGSHIKEEENRNPLTCLVCKLEFDDMESRLSHEKKHSRNGYYHCEVCRSRFSNVIRFISHRKFVHSC